MCSTYRAYLGRSWRLRASDTGQCMDQFGRLIVQVVMEMERPWKRDLIRSEAINEGDGDGDSSIDFE